jgi:hypothetical protein
MAENLETGAKPSRWSIEVVGEMILLTIVGSFFVYLFVKSLGWQLGAALMPRIVVIIGMPFLILRVIALLRRSDKPAGDIMDMGFRIGDDPTGERRRFIRIGLYIAGLYLAIWIFGWHLALPLGMAFYVRVYGKMGWTGTIIVWASFLGTILLVYDQLLHATWHEPLVVKLWNKF